LPAPDPVGGPSKVKPTSPTPPVNPTAPDDKASRPSGDVKPPAADTNTLPAPPGGSPPGGAGTTGDSHPPSGPPAPPPVAATTQDPHGRTPPGGAHAAEPQRRPVPPIRLVNSREVSLAYQLSKVGPSGLGTVKLFLTRNGGEKWEEFADDP